jgi:hypothetical protein
VVIVFVVWIIADYLTRFVGKSNRLALGLGGAGWAERAASVIQNKFATAEDGLGVLETVGDTR